jgi:CRP-like cAMP-binding protein
MALWRSERLPAALLTATTYRELTAGEVLFHQGDPALAIFTVETGRLRIVRHTLQGKMVTFQVARSGESFAEAALFADIYNCDAVAEVASRVAAYPKPLLLELLHDYPELTQDFMVRLVKQIQCLKVRLELRDIPSAHERVLQYLRLMAEPADKLTINFDRPLKDIASELGLTPETLSRVLTRLEKEGVITRTKQKITLCNTSTSNAAA